MRRKRNFGKALKPKSTREFMFRGVRFFTRNLGAVEQMNNKFVWFAVGSWTHDGAYGVFSSIEAAIADRFNIWEHLGLSYAQKFRDSEQLKAVAELRSEIATCMRDAR